MAPNHNLPIISLGYDKLYRYALRLSNLVRKHQGGTKKKEETSERSSEEGSSFLGWTDVQ